MVWVLGLWLGGWICEQQHNSVHVTVQVWWQSVWRDGDFKIFWSQHVSRPHTKRAKKTVEMEPMRCCVAVAVVVPGPGVRARGLTFEQAFEAEDQKSKAKTFWIFFVDNHRCVKYSKINVYLARLEPLLHPLLRHTSLPASDPIKSISEDFGKLIIFTYNLHM